MTPIETYTQRLAEEIMAHIILRGGAMIPPEEIGTMTIEELISLILPNGIMLEVGFTPNKGCTNE